MPSRRITPESPAPSRRARPRQSPWILRRHGAHDVGRFMSAYWCTGGVGAFPEDQEPVGVEHVEAVGLQLGEDADDADGVVTAAELVDGERVVGQERFQVTVSRSQESVRILSFPIN